MKVSLLQPQISAIPAEDQLTPEVAVHLDEIAETLDEDAAALDKAGLSIRANQLRVVSNNLTSYGDAAKDGDATIAMYQDILTRIKKFDAEVATINAELSAKTTRSLPAEFASASATLESILGKIDPTQVEEAASKGIAEILMQLAKRNKQLNSQLPRNSVKDYSLVKLPVVVVLNRGYKAEDFRRAGFEVQAFEGYPVISDQILLAVRHDYARTQFPDEDYPAWTMALEILDTIKKTSGTELQMVSEEAKVPRSGARQFAFYWLAPEPYLSRLHALLGPFEGWDLAL